MFSLFSLSFNCHSIWFVFEELRFPKTSSLELYFISKHFPTLIKFFCSVFSLDILSSISSKMFKPFYIFFNPLTLKPLFTKFCCKILFFTSSSASLALKKCQTLHFQKNVHKFSTFIHSDSYLVCVTHKKLLLSRWHIYCYNDCMTWVHYARTILCPQSLK